MKSLRKFVNKSAWPYVLDAVKVEFESVKKAYANGKLKPRQFEEWHSEAWKLAHFPPRKRMAGGWEVNITPRFLVRTSDGELGMPRQDEFEVVIEDDGEKTSKISYNGGYGTFFGIYRKKAPQWYGVKFDFNQKKNEDAFEFAKKLSDLSDELGIGIEIKDVKFQGGNITFGEVGFGHIYPRFENDLNDTQTMEKLIEFYSKAKRMGVDVQLNKSEADLEPQKRLKLELEKRKLI